MLFMSTETVGLLGTEAQDIHLDFHTAPDLRRVGGLKRCFTSTETVGLLGTGAQDIHLDFHTAPGLCLLSRHLYEIAVCPGMQMQGVVQFMPHV